MRVFVVSGVLLLGLASLPVAAAAEVSRLPAAAPGWKLVRVNTLPADDLLADVTVLSNGTVWAAGHRLRSGRQYGLVQSYDGRSWKTIPANLPHHLDAVTATSNKNVWVFGNGNASRWNGRTWTTRSLDGLPVSDADGTGAKDIWAVSGEVPLAGHWNGSKWQKVRTPVAAKAVDAYKKGEVWAAGTKGNRAAIMRWNGRAWTLVPTPALSLPSPDALAVLNDIAVLGPGNVWAVGGVHWEGANAEGDDVLFTRTLVLRLTGGSWTATIGAAEAQPYTEVEPDGRGGVWVAQGSWNATLWQVTGTEWTSLPLPRKKGTDAALFSLARRPGTTTLWGSGFTVPQGDPDDPSSNGTFWRTWP